MKDRLRGLAWVTLMKVGKGMQQFNQKSLSVLLDALLNLEKKPEWFKQKVTQPIAMVHEISKSLNPFSGKLC